jgi:hypothetical protein
VGLFAVNRSETVVKNVADSEVKGKAIPVTGREGPYDYETPWFPYFVYTVDSEMAVRLSALGADRPLPPPPGRFLILISVRG